jgi:hypothetical protein
MKLRLFAWKTAKVFVMYAVPNNVSSGSMPPCRVQGMVTVDGVATSDGTVITASIGGTQVALGNASGGKFKIQFDAANYLGKTIVFTVGNAPANETAKAAYGFVKINLTATAQRR